MRLLTPVFRRPGNHARVSGGLSHPRLDLTHASICAPDPPDRFSSYESWLKLSNSALTRWQPLPEFASPSDPVS